MVYGIEGFTKELTETGKRVCTYVMAYDSGMAPNPFHGLCTLAVCTPNHMRARLNEGDWIIGINGSRIQSKIGQTASNRRVIYVMRIDNRMDLDTYYETYPEKRPKLIGTPIEMAGDAFYRTDDSGLLRHTGETNDHKWDSMETKDIKGNRVFMGKTFWYFGKKCLELPNAQWANILSKKFDRSARGIRYVRDGSGLQWSKSDIECFLSWLPDKPGIYGNPIDRDMGTGSCKGSCDHGQ